MAIDKRWEKVATKLQDSCLYGKNKYWTVGKQNRWMDVHLYAIDWLIKNESKYSSNVLDKELQKVVNIKFPDRTFSDKYRPLFLSKILGLIENYPSSKQAFKTTPAYQRIKNSEGNQFMIDELLSKQAEKFFFWGGLHSLVNRHAVDNRNAIDSFEIYPIFFLYELIKKLTPSYPYGKISEFELTYLIITREKNSDVEECLEDILAYRNSPFNGSSKDEVEKYLIDSIKDKQFAKPDNRMSGILNLVKFFNIVDGVLQTNIETEHEMLDRLSKFKLLESNNQLIKFDQNDKEKYHDFLYSEKDFFEYFETNSSKSTY